jgi:hypothetical protein
LTYTDHLEELKTPPSVGSRSEARDNAMAEAWVATFKSELVDERRFPSFEHEVPRVDRLLQRRDSTKHLLTCRLPRYEELKQTTPQMVPAT